MKSVVFYAYPPEPDGQSLQGHSLMRGLAENGEDVIPCDPEKNFQKQWVYEAYKPDVTIGIGFWGDTPRMIIEPLKYGIQPVPWFNADGWVANYHDILNKLPLIVTTSNWVKSTYIRDGIKEDIIEVMPIGFDPKIFYPMPKNDPMVFKIREMLGVKKDEKMLLTIGGDVTSKGAQEMFRALAKIVEKFPNWKYVCKVWESYSARDHGKEEHKLIEELGLDPKRIIFLKGKFSPEFMSYLLNACDIYAAPSRLEGFGMIQLEAQACGKPVISIDVGGPKDTIVHGKTGYLVDVEHEVKLEREWVNRHMGFKKKMLIEFPRPKTFAYRANTDQLADYTLKLFKDDKLRETIGIAAAEHAFKNFHYKDIAKRMAELIKRKLNINQTVISSVLTRQKYPSKKPS
ncbi:glycosyltransferase family 4 protein [Candidatus Pacearchaeota archaeon]|nr:glycosyltransferase family 4 protein [Candidatus Pacearchaeota archaeon]